MSGLSDEDVDKALDYLEETCDTIADAKAELERSEILRKRTRERVFLTAEGNVAERKAWAEVSAESEKADERYIDAVQAFKALDAKRDVRVIQIEVYRTQESSRRQVRP